MAVHRPERSTVPGPGFSSTLIQWYFVILSAMLIGSVVVWAIWGMGPASPLLFLFAIGLIGAWLVI